MFRTADPTELGCAATIEWHRPPGGYQSSGGVVCRFAISVFCEEESKGSARCDSRCQSSRELFM